MELWDVRPTAGCDLNQSSTLRNFLSLRQVNAGFKGGGATVFDFSGNAEINVSLEAKKILIDGVVHHPYRYHPLKLPNSFMSILFCYFTWKRQSSFFTLKSKIYLLGRHLLKISIIVSLVEVFYIWAPIGVGFDWKSNLFTASILLLALVRSMSGLRMQNITVYYWRKFKMCVLRFCGVLSLLKLPPTPASQ